MPKVHNIGKQHFVQFFRFPAAWGKKFVVRGETNEINHPYRHSKPFMIRMPFYHVLVIGKWLGEQDEVTALQRAVQERILTDEDFQEGWTPPAYQAGEESLEDFDY